MSAALGSQVHGPGRVEIGRASGGNYPSWVVCGRKTRDVIGGIVHCPHRGSVGVDVCLGCHLLVTSARERDLRVACSTAE